MIQKDKIFDSRSILRYHLASIKTCFLFLFLLNNTLYAKVSFSLSGKHQDRYLGFYQQQTTTGSLSVEFGLTPLLTLSLVHSREQDKQNGLKTNEEQSEFTPYTSLNLVTSNSIQFVKILFRGQIMPYLFLGVGFYEVNTIEDIGGEVTESLSSYPGPQAGLGFLVPISKQFSIKFSHTFSFGVLKTEENQTGSTRTNGSSQLGIRYTPR